MSNVSIAEASRQLPQLIEQMTDKREVIFITANGERKAVLMDIASFWRTIGLEEYINQPLRPWSEFQKEFHAALVEAGYDTTEKIVDLVNEVKEEMAEERRLARMQAQTETHR